MTGGALRLRPAGTIIMERNRIMPNPVKVMAILAARPAGHLLAPRLMEAVYAKLLTRMETVGWAPPRQRIRVSKPALLWTVARLVVTR